MNNRLFRRAAAAVALAAGGLLTCGAIAASAKPILMLNLHRELAQQQAYWQQHLYAPAGPIQPPAPPCPENGLLPPPFSNCGVPELPATTLPWMGNMAYYGGHVQVTPKEYLVYWGWGEGGAWPSGTSCSSTSFTEGASSATLACDPDGAGKYMADFLQQVGGTPWAGVQTQYYQTDSSGSKTFVTNPAEQLAGIWVDDTNPNTLPKTSLSNSAGSTNTLTVLGEEAQRAVGHFALTDLNDANIVIVQPPGLSDPNALSQGYCAFHDYTWPGVAGNVYNGIAQGISYSNIPYQLAINSGGVNVCGENAVNTGSQGKLDGYSIVLGHEMEETVTDPGAEDVLGGSGLNNQTFLGGWYDTVDANENGDKCAWVGENLLTGQGPPEPIYGALGDIKGNTGTTFAVQSLWSNQANAGTGYCAGAGTDSPVPNG